MHFTKYVSAVFVVFLIFTFGSVFVMAASVGVQPGHWAKYEVSAMGYDYSLSKISISSVGGTTVSGTFTYWYTHESPITESFQGDVLDGETFPYIILASLNEGDPISSAYGSPTIEGVTKKGYAGSSRTVVYATQYLTTYYWDQKTGILVEQKWGTGAVTSSIKLTETNIWGGGIFDISRSLSWILPIIIVVIVGVVLLAIILPFLRRKKLLEETVTPRSTAPPPTAPSSPPKEESGETKYCPKCGASMPLDAVYCLKCGHQQPKT